MLFLSQGYDRVNASFFHFFKLGVMFYLQALQEKTEFEMRLKEAELREASLAAQVR